LVTSYPKKPQGYKFLHSGCIRRLPIVENGRLVGIVTDRDLIRYIVQIANEPQIPPEIQELLKSPLASKMSK
jgi:CBS domain-containing protein